MFVTDLGRCFEPRKNKKEGEPGQQGHQDPATPLLLVLLWAGGHVLFCSMSPRPTFLTHLLSSREQRTAGKSLVVSQSEKA